MVRASQQALWMLSSVADKIAVVNADLKTYSLGKFIQMIANVRSYQVFRSYDKALGWIGPARTNSVESFHYELKVIRNSYVHVYYRGQPTSEGITKAGEELCSLLKKSACKGLLLDINDVEVSYSTLSVSIEYYKRVSMLADRIAVHAGSWKIFSLMKFFALVTGIKKWRLFKSKSDAERYVG